MRRFIYTLFALVLVLGAVLGVQMTREPETVYANNIDATNITLTGSDPVNDYTYIQFDIGWDYSWKDTVNHDAAWVFVKYKETGGVWNHATLSATDGDHSATTTNGVAATIDAASDNTGVFIYRTSEGNGPNNWDGVKLRWEYGTDGLGDYDKVTVRVFAIEMVYIPQASFYVGDADCDQTYCFYKYGTTDPYQITSEAAIEMGETSNYLWARWGKNIETATLPADFPKGYQAFYCMKYETSQRQYAEFLNTLTQAQQETRTADTLSNEDAAGHYVMIGEDRTTVLYRHGIKAGSNPADGQPYTFGCDLNDNGVFNEANDGEWITMHWSSWMDACAYADWAGLRPFTELEFEKICRGDQAVVDDEYAWGSTNIVKAVGITNPGEDGEVSSNDANVVYDGGISGSLRSGALTDSDDTREQSGASYYGVMEMSGNEWEQVVSVVNSDGRSFTGSHGDGVLETTAGYEGNATNSDWPGYTAGQGVSGGDGGGARGGNWEYEDSDLRVADRLTVGEPNESRTPGFRLVRTE